MHPALRLVRLNNVLVSFVGTLVGGLAAGGIGIAFRPAVLGALALAAVSTACITAGGNVLNDVTDVESDRVNHPDRPIVTGAISRSGGVRLVWVLFGVGVLVVAPQWTTRPELVIVLAAALAALLGYELRFKAVGFAGNLLVAFLTGAVFLYGAASVGPTALVVPFALMAFFATLSREVIKDMEDAAGDVDRRTLPRTRGFGVATRLARGSVVLALLLSPLPLLYWFPWRSIVGIMYIASVLAADALFVASVRPLPERLHWAQSVSKLAMTVALVAFLVTAFR